MEGARLPSPSTYYTAAPPASLPALTEGAAASITRRLAVGSAKPLTRPKGEASPEPKTMTTGALQSGHVFGPWPPPPRPSSHVSMQAVWYRCPHGSVVAFSPSAKAHKQIAQSSPVSPAPQLAVGSAATAVDSSSSVAPPPPPPPLPVCLRHRRHRSCRRLRRGGACAASASRGVRSSQRPRGRRGA